MSDKESRVVSPPSSEPSPPSQEEQASLPSFDVGEIFKSPDTQLSTAVGFSFSETYPEAFKQISDNIAGYSNDGAYDSDDGFDFKEFVSLNQLVDLELFGADKDAAAVVAANFGTVFGHQSDEEITQRIQSLPAPGTVEQGLAQLTLALDSNVGYFHVIEGEGRGRAFKKYRLEPTRARLQEIGQALALEGVTSQEERDRVLLNRQFTVAVSKQLFAEGALELADIPKFARLLKVAQGLSNQEAVKFLSENLSDEEMKILHQATEQTLSNRMDRPPPLWVMVKGGEIKESEVEEITSGRVNNYDAFLRRVFGTKYSSSTLTAFSPSSERYFGSSADGVLVRGGWETADAPLAGVLGQARMGPDMPTLELLEWMDRGFRSSSDPEARDRGLAKYFEEVAQILLQADQERKEEQRQEADGSMEDSLRVRIKRHLEQTLARLGMQDEVLDHTLLEYSNPDNPLSCYIKIDDIIALARARMALNPAETSQVETQKPIETVIAKNPIDELLVG